jgi:hypothetical protein
MNKQLIEVDVEGTGRENLTQDRRVPSSGI